MTGSALIVGLGLNGLGVARSLKAAGIRAHALDDNLASIYAATNACTKSRAELAGEGLITALAAYRGTIDHDPVLFLTREDGVATVAANRSRIAGYRIAMPEPAVVTALVNKDRFLAIAHAADILIPRTVTLESRDDVARLGELTPPFIVKPTAHIAAYQALYKKAYIFGSVAEAEETVRGMIDTAGEIVGQDYVPGDDGSVFFCLGYFGEGGALLAGFTGYKTASWPPRVGGTGGCAPAPGVYAELAEATERFFKTAGFRGMGSLEFKRHAETGRFYMIEPTACRTDYQSELATLNGVNLPAVQFAEQMRRPLPPARPTAHHGWRDSTAVASGAAVPRSGDGWRAVDAVWRVDDMGPGLRMTRRRVTGKLRKLLGRR